jgi:CheY-like chemotaxis protein
MAQETAPLQLLDVMATATQSPPHPQKEEQSVKLRALVVDDNEDAADMLAEAMRMLEVDTRVAHDGPEAIRVVEEFRPHLVFLDIGLPIMDGYELASRLLSAPTTQPPRLVAITGYGQDSDRERTAKAGFDAHLVKPVDIRVISKLLDRYRLGESI